MTYLRPTYVIDLGGISLSSESLGPIVGLEVSRALNGPADCAVVRLAGPLDELPEAGDQATIELGWDGDAETVFTGTVAWSERRLASLEIVCLGGSMPLSYMRGDSAFLDQSAGDVVKALASEAEVDIDTVEDGAQLPAYFVDSGSTYYGHCLYLARLSGLALYTTQDGELVFATLRSVFTDHMLRYGADVLEVRADAGRPIAGAKVVPESPSSSAGADSASWFSKDSSSFAGSAGRPPETLTADPLLRSKEAAAAAAGSLVALRERYSARGEVSLMGRPEIHLGDSVGFDDVDGLTDVYLVTAVSHVLSRSRGFRSLVSFGGS